MSQVVHLLVVFTEVSDCSRPELKKVKPVIIFNVNYNCRWIIGVLAQSCLNALLECGLFLLSYLQSSGMKNLQTVNQTIVFAPLMVPLVIRLQLIVLRR